MKKILKISAVIGLCVSCGSEVVDFPNPTDAPFDPISDLPCPPDAGNGEVHNPNGPLPDLINHNGTSSSSSGNIAIDDAGDEAEASTDAEVDASSSDASSDAGPDTDAGNNNDSGSVSDAGSPDVDAGVSDDAGSSDDAGNSSSSSSSGSTSSSSSSGSSTSSSGSTSSSSSSSSGSSGTSGTTSSSSSSGSSSGSDHECSNQTGLTCEQKLHCCMDTCQDAHQLNKDGDAHTCCVQACAKAHKVCVFLRLPHATQVQICNGQLVNVK